MEDSQIAAAQRELDQMYDLDDFISELQGTICKEIEQYLWTNSESAHDLAAAESIIESQTGTSWDIEEILFDLAESDGMSSGVTCNPKQIYGFMGDLMKSKMNNDSALELAAILAEYVTQDVESIEAHYKQDNYDGPDADGDY
jgi:hypothetical protein